MSIYSDVPLLPWEYVLAAILGVSMLWLVLRATRKAERRRAETLRTRVPEQQAGGDGHAPAVPRQPTGTARSTKDDH